MGIVVSFAGRIGSGKSSVSNVLAEALGWPRAGFGDYLRDELRRRGGDMASRQALQDLGQSFVEVDPEAFCRSVLGRVCKGFQPESDHADRDHGEVVGGALFVAGGDAAELLEAVDQPPHKVAPPIRLAVEGGLATLVALGRNERCDAATAHPAARRRAAVAFVTGD